ncbi:MAG: endolytic transglycosylase MltG [Chloroflexi bacterium]|nr:endolytic transglycosylase MltG [Chloroflexota bacterium]
MPSRWLRTGVVLASAAGLTAATALGANCLTAQLPLPANSWDAKPTTEGTFTVQSGESAAVIGRRLKEAGLIPSPFLFQLLVTYYGIQGRLEAGTYQLQRGMTITTILRHLNGGLVRPVVITIPEGWRGEEIAAYLEREGIVKEEAFLTLFRDGTGSRTLLQDRPPGATLEGYLFPDTYYLSPSSTAGDIIALMLDDFDARFAPAMRRQAADRGLTTYQVLTLASIVEREAVRPEERPIIASVFLNRLNRGMTLDADPTVQYALGSLSPQRAKYGFWKGKLTQEDMATNSPYNTYRHPGLPPGPIANPGLDSLKAVVQPAQTSYLYFVAREDGSHVFSSSLEEHIRNVNRYQR